MPSKLTGNDLRTGSVHTLAQVAVKGLSQKVDLITGKGSDCLNDKLTKNRAKRKLVSQSVAAKMITYAQSIGDEESAKKYRNTYYCQSELKEVEGRTYGNYCGNRLCTVCTANRKAELIRKYLPIIASWKDPYFVTITAKACKGSELKKHVANVLIVFGKVKDRIRDKNRRGKCERLVGIRSLESNFNPKMRTYNPHIHVIVDGEDMANLIIQEWQSVWTHVFADSQAQHKRAVKKEKINDLIEVIKYSTKIFTEPEKGQRGREKIYIASLHTIDKAMRGRRLFASFGFKLPKGAYKEPSGTSVSIGVRKFKYSRSMANWVDPETDEVLSDFHPDLDLLMRIEYWTDTTRK